MEAWPLPSHTRLERTFPSGLDVVGSNQTCVRASVTTISARSFVSVDADALARFFTAFVLKKLYRGHRIQLLLIGSCR